MSNDETNSDNPTRANCDKHGSLGNYSSPEDARRGETLHHMTAHPDSISVAEQNKRNKGQGDKK